MKRQIAAVLSAAFIFTSTMQVYAEPKFNYTFEEATKIAIENSADYTSAIRSLESSSEKYDDVYDATPSKVNFSTTLKNFINKQLPPQLNLENVYSTYQQAILKKEAVRKNLLLDLRKAVIDIQKYQMSVDEAAIQQDLKKSELSALNSRYSLGLVAEKDYESKKFSIEKEIAQLDKVDKTLGLAYRTLNTLLGKSDERDVSVQLDDTLIPLEKLDLDKIKNDLKKNDTSVGTLNNQLRVSSLSYSLINEKDESYDNKNLSPEAEDELNELYEDAKEDYSFAEKSYNTAVKDFDNNFDDMIEDIEDTYTDIEDIKRDIEDEKENINIYTIKYKTGLLSKIEFDTAKINLTLLENDLKALELDLNMKYANLLIWSDLKKVVKE